VRDVRLRGRRKGGREGGGWIDKGRRNWRRVEGKMRNEGKVQVIVSRDAHVAKFRRVERALV
jgi:hypothetical protein